MTQFIMMASERLREKTEEQKDSDQTSWVGLHHEKRFTHQKSRLTPI